MKDVIKAAQLMVMAHRETDSMNQAIQLVEEEIDSLNRQILCALWIGINAKDREDLDT